MDRALSARPKDCPCHSGRRYKECCGPLHDGTRRAETPAELMRSRYAAFSIGDGRYLFETLASTHEDRAAPRAEVERALSRVRERQRFLQLLVLHEASAGDTGEVLFFAKVFEKGTDLSFAELSEFVREDGAWRYATGVLVPGARLPDPRTLDRDGFLALAKEL